ncbi:MAG: polyribonucleotide nucleotidyltransferase, partial [Pseudomonadota bacterium]
MFNVIKKSIQWGGETLTLETGKVARQADGTVIATLGETSVMANVTFAKSAKPGQDFFPLTVHYQEKYYAAGKIPGGFFKREARPSEKETLTSRLIDRPCRPLFVEGFKNEVLVMATVLSHDLHNEPDVVAMIAASAALTISGVPFMGPIGAARVGFSNGEYVLNPSVDDMQKLRNNPEQRLDLIVAGTKDAVMMVESEAYELTEAEMLGAVKFGHAAMQPVIDLIIDLAEDAAKEPFDFHAPDYSALYAKVKTAGEAQLLVLDREGGAHLRFASGLHLGIKRGIVRGVEIERLFCRVFRQIDDQVDHRLHRRMAKLHGTQHFGFGQLVGF